MRTFKTSSEGYDRNEVDAFVRTLEDAQAHLYQQASNLEAALVSYQQYRTATEELQTQLTARQRDMDEAMQGWLTSALPALREYQETVGAANVEPPSSITRIVPGGVAFHRPNRPIYLPLLLLAAATALAGM